MKRLLWWIKKLTNPGLPSWANRLLIDESIEELEIEFNLIRKVAQEIYDKHDEIYKEAEIEVTQRGGYADDPDEIEMAVSDIIDEIIYNKLYEEK